MGYIALYNKYRPQTFDDVVGQEIVVQTLQKMIATGKIANGYLLVGNRGLGKTTLAKIIAKAINCTGNDNLPFDGPKQVPCNECASCKSITNGTSFDMVEMDAASNRGVDAIRDTIINKVQYKPRGKYKVYIVDECHMLTTEAWNALLKTLETPPPYVVFIFCTTNPEKIPKTIISRLQTYYLKDMTNDDIVKRLKYICKCEGFKADNEALYAIARYAKGGMRDSISALDQISAFTNHITEDDVLSVLGILSEGDCYDVFKSMISKDIESLAKVLADITENQNKDISDIYSMLQTYARISLNVLIGIKFEPSEISRETFDIIKKDIPKLATVSDMQRYIELLVDNDMNYKYAYDKIIILVSITSKFSKEKKSVGSIDIDAIVKTVLSKIGSVPVNDDTERAVNDIRKKLNNDTEDDEPDLDAVRDIKKWFKKQKGKK